MFIQTTFTRSWINIPYKRSRNEDENEDEDIATDMDVDGGDDDDVEDVDADGDGDDDDVEDGLSLALPAKVALAAETLRLQQGSCCHETVPPPLIGNFWAPISKHS